jgi:hypothetical protein
MTEQAPPHGEGEGFVVIDRAYELAREMTRRVRAFPRDLRFVLGDRLLTTTYDILDALITCRYVKAERAAELRRVNLLLERLRFQVRLCQDERLISVRQYEYLSTLLQTLGGLVGSWEKKAGR